MIDPAVLRGCDVLFGFSAPGLLDLRPTPMSRVRARRGAARHGAGRPARRRLPARRAGGDRSGRRSRCWRSSPRRSCWRGRKAWHGLAAILVTLPVPPLLGVGGYALGWWFPVVPAGLAAAAALGGGLVWNYATEGRQRRFLKQAFRHYLSPHVIERLIADPGQLRLGGERRELTIMFSDLAGFSSISESLDPVALTELLNDFLSDMTDIVLEEGGTLDKYEGDAIIAFWNAPLEVPDHAGARLPRRVRCQQQLADRREEFRARTGDELHMRVGLHTGAVVVGNMGSRQRFNYTVLGRRGQPGLAAGGREQGLRHRDDDLGRDARRRRRDVRRPRPRRGPRGRPPRAGARLRAAGSRIAHRQPRVRRLPCRPGALPQRRHARGRRRLRRAAGRPGRPALRGALWRSGGERRTVRRHLEPDQQVGVAMRIHFAGVRGSWPRTAPTFAQYGGDTTCLLVTPREGPPAFIDAGTGIAAAAERTPRPGGDLLLLLTHTHHDHLQGLPSLGPLYEPGRRLTVAAPDFVPAEVAVRKLMGPPLWPLDLDTAGATVVFRRLAGAPASVDPFAWGSLEIRHLAVPHPGGGAAYRLDESGGGAFVFATDIEWGAWDDAGRAAFARFCREPRPVDLLVMDGQFTGAEIAAHRGWGHSSLGECAAAAREGGAGRLLTTHHAPDRDDTAMAVVEAELAELLPGAAAARQGRELEI